MLPTKFSLNVRDVFNRVEKNLLDVDYPLFGYKSEGCFGGDADGKSLFLSGLPKVTAADFDLSTWDCNNLSGNFDAITNYYLSRACLAERSADTYNSRSLPCFDSSSTCRAGKKGDWNRDLYYESFLEAGQKTIRVARDYATFTYLTDHKGRVVSAKTEKLKPVGSNPAWRHVSRQRATLGRKLTDDGGHLIATEFGGPGEPINMVPMARGINRSGGAFRRLEQGWSKAARKPTRTVKVEVRLAYPDSPTSFSRSLNIADPTQYRPERFEIRQEIDGKCRIFRVDNKNSARLKRYAKNKDLRFRTCDGVDRSLSENLFSEKFSP